MFVFLIQGVQEISFGFCDFEVKCVKNWGKLQITIEFSSLILLQNW